MEITSTRDRKARAWGSGSTPDRTGHTARLRPASQKLGAALENLLLSVLSRSWSVFVLFLLSENAAGYTMLFCKLNLDVPFGLGIVVSLLYLKSTTGLPLLDGTEQILVIQAKTKTDIFQTAVILKSLCLQ